MVQGIQEKGGDKDQPRMGPILKKAVLIISGICFLLFGAWRSSRAIVDRVVAVVNRDIILLSDLDQWKGALVAQIKAVDRLEKQEQTQDVLRKILDRLIEDKLIDQAAKKLEIKLTAKELENAIEDIKRRNGFTTQEEFEKALAQDGLTLESLKKQLEPQVLRMKVVGMLAKVETKPEEKELRKFYEQNKNRYVLPETYRPAHILFRVSREDSPEEVQKIEKKCQTVLENIKKGADFREMAGLFSEDASSRDGGDLGFFKKGELIPILEGEALKLKVGEVSGVVRTDFGFHILKLLDRRGGEWTSFEDVREKVLTDYNEREVEKSYQQFMATLKQKAVIEIKL